jgi:hypothetical protein
MVQDGYFFLSYSAHCFATLDAQKNYVWFESDFLRSESSKNYLKKYVSWYFTRRKVNYAYKKVTYAYK